ncbi:hypothetical protein TNCV_2987271 [Trichonephila clavipes]|nr:hypothetical protein TNCV_2987271 [Trichonephila clavipes]
MLFFGKCFHYPPPTNPQPAAWPISISKPNFRLKRFVRVGKRLQICNSQFAPIPQDQIDILSGFLCIDRRWTVPQDPNVASVIRTVGRSVDNISNQHLASGFQRLPNI